MKNIKELLSVYIMPVFCAVSSAVALFFWCCGSITFINTAAVILSSASVGFLFCFILSLIPSGTWRYTLAIVFSSLQGLITLVGFFVADYYKAFMPISDIFSGAGGVINQFMSEAIKEILSGWWMILICAVPIIAFAVIPRFTVKKVGYTDRKTSRILWGSCFLASILLSSAAIIISPDNAVLSENFNFDSSVRTYGMPVSLTADVYHRVFKPENTFNSETENTESEPEKPAPAEKVYEKNKFNIDFELLSENEKNASVKNAYQYLSSLTPSTQNKYTGLFKGKNLIFITAEAFSGEVIDKVLTPTLYRLANTGIKFTDYYQPAWGGSTSSGEYSNLTGLIPTRGVDSLKVAANDNMYFTLGNQFQRLGYYTAAYHDNLYTYYDRHITHKNLGYFDYMGYGNGMEKGIHYTWPESDLEMINFTVDKYVDKQPFHIYYMTVSGHGGYRVKGNNMSRKNYSEVEYLERTEEVKCYLAAQYELELALSSLISQLDDAGILDNTVIALGSDHYPYSLSDLSALYGYEADTCEKRDHSALIIWSPSIEGMNITVSTPTYSLDIVPTLSNLFGIPYDSRMLVGRDVFSDQMPLVLWSNKSWKTDIGYYDSASKTFTPAEGKTVPDGYVRQISSIVSDKFKYSSIVLENNLYGKIFGSDDIK